MTFEMPVALPPEGRYSVASAAERADLEVTAEGVAVRGVPAAPRLRLEFDVRAE